MSGTDEALLARCAAIGVSTWSDALDEAGIAGTLAAIPKRNGSGRMCGFAVTARYLSGQRGDFATSDFAVGRLIDAMAPGRVLMVDIGGASISTLGGLAALAASLKGAGGVVIDGACRDLDEIRATDLWVASRWVAPTTGKGRLKLLPLGCDIRVGGIAIAAGDLAVGDDTGIVVVPRARLAEVLAAAERIVAVDEAVERGIRAGESFAAAAAAANYIPAPSDPASSGVG